MFTVFAAYLCGTITVRMVEEWAEMKRPWMAYSGTAIWLALAFVAAFG